MTSDDVIDDIRLNLANECEEDFNHCMYLVKILEDLGIHLDESIHECFCSNDITDEDILFYKRHGYVQKKRQTTKQIKS